MNPESYIQRLSCDQLAIFLFHGVVEKSEYSVRNYTKKHLEKDEFYGLLSRLKRTGNAVTIDEIVKHHIEGKPFPKFSFAITFDDGFENNFSLAAPMLSDLSIPAAFYVSTDLIENNSMTWIDRIEYCLENKQKGLLRFEWIEEELSFDGQASKIELLEYLRSKVKSDPNIDSDEVAQSVFSQCEIEPIDESSDPLDKKMNWEQVQILHNEKLFTVGGHSHHHLNLASLEADELEFELGTSIRLLKERTGIDIKHYAYPEGLEHCFSESVIQKLKSFDIISSTTAINGLNDFETDLFRLRRIIVE